MFVVQMQLPSKKARLNTLGTVDTSCATDTKCQYLYTIDPSLWSFIFELAGLDIQEFQCIVPHISKGFRSMLTDTRVWPGFAILTSDMNIYQFIKERQLHIHTAKVCCERNKKSFWFDHIETTSIRKLVLNYNLSDTSLDVLKNTPRLQNLKLLYCHNLTNNGLRHVRSIQLNQLDLNDITHLTDAALTHLRFQPLQRLKLSYGRKLTGTGFVNFRRMPLQELHLEQCSNITDDSLAHLRTLSQLQSLTLDSCTKLTGRGFTNFRLLPLKHLNLSGCDSILDSSILHLRPLIYMQYLNLSECKNISDASLANLSSMTQLQTLKLSYCKKLTAVGMAHLGSLPLTSLDLCCCSNISDAGLAHLRSLPLQNLNLAQCKKISDVGLAHLGSMSQLQTLKLSGCMRITDDGLAHLRYSQLVCLYLNACKVTDRGMQYLSYYH